MEKGEKMEREKERKTVYTVLMNGEVIDVTTDVWEASRDVEHAVSMQLGQLHDHRIEIKIEAWSVLI